MFPSLHFPLAATVVIAFYFSTVQEWATHSSLVQKAIIQKAFPLPKPQDEVRRLTYQGFYWLNKLLQQIPQKFSPRDARTADLFVEVIEAMWMCQLKEHTASSCWEHLHHGTMLLPPLR